jgi:Cellulose binding domain
VDRPGGWRALASAWRPGRRSGGARRARPAGHKLGPAIRRLMVTPTFAAGLGVLVAAGLAANMPRTVLHFSSPVPGIQCSAGVCATEEPNSGTLASARPGVHISPPSPGTSGSSSAGPDAANRRGDGRTRSSGSAGRVTVTYLLTHQWQGGFIDQISITGMDARRSSWSLALGYPGARVTNVLGAQWQATSPDAGVAEGYPESAGRGPGLSGDGGQHGQAGSSWVQFTVVLDGPPMAPVGCDFDGTPCTFSGRTQP